MVFIVSIPAVGQETDGVSVFGQFIATGTTQTVADGIAMNGAFTSTAFKMENADMGKSVEQANLCLNGNWAGCWSSCTTGHQGRLTATFCQIDSAHVRATFRGTFAKVFRFRYRAVLTIVDERPGLVRLSGCHRLGPLMGTFTYDAIIEGTSFRATYHSRRDRGTWLLRRQDANGCQADIMPNGCQADIMPNASKGVFDVPTP